GHLGSGAVPGIVRAARPNSHDVATHQGVIPWPRTVLPVLALVSLLAFAGHARAAEPGVVSLVNGNAFQRIQSSGAKHVRLFVSWRGMEPRPGNLDPATLGAYDDLINRLRGIGVNVYFVVVQTPAWASSSGAVDAPPPAALFADFMRRLAAHFQGRGLAYEVSSAPDYPVFWQGSAPPVVYAALLRAVYVAIKAGDP